MGTKEWKQKHCHCYSSCCFCEQTTSLLFFPTASTCLHVEPVNPIQSDRSIDNTPSNPPITQTTMSSFLTLSRRALVAPTRNTLLKPLAAAQPFSTTISRNASGETEGKNPDSTHATRNKDQLDVQSANSKEAREDRKKDVGGNATREKDEVNSKSKAKQEFPESPVQIGMEDERGGKGV